jgi:hypothetical protein
VLCGLASESEIELADARFKFTERERDLFESRKMGGTTEKNPVTGKVTDRYAKLMIATKSGKYFVRNKVGKMELWITTTKPDETFVYHYAKDVIMKGSSTAEVIAWLMSGEYRNKDAPHYQDLDIAIKKAGRKWPTL